MLRLNSLQNFKGGFLIEEKEMTQKRAMQNCLHVEKFPHFYPQF
jgi:hypothetical protein